ncbi:MAG TPA: class I SAM-dependent methyltransferase [Lacipirellulaceae bacterium]|jgi:cyclopropane fatty-acyl-phospholipid synthase-like methyltransferase|nr:class I SAM-dependent methyltransferase [Lacipirellulaceae bacterium]
MSESSTYRWNTSAAAEAYDAAAPVIHPYYEKVQDEILGLLSFGAEEAFELMDIGGGSGRLAERVMERFAGARVTVVDQSAPFLALAERRLARFGPRAAFVQSRLQDDWDVRCRVSPRRDRVSEKLAYVDVIVSTSAIHHLEPAEKRTLFAKCFAALAPGGMFINGDEFRPESDAEFRELLNEWSVHMNRAIAAGRIPKSFRATFDAWEDRNIKHFGEPKKSGDDCQETVDAQIAYFQTVGFAAPTLVWSDKLWGVLKGQKN